MDREYTKITSKQMKLNLEVMNNQQEPRLPEYYALCCLHDCWLLALLFGIERLPGASLLRLTTADGQKYLIITYRFDIVFTYELISNKTKVTLGFSTQNDAPYVILGRWRCRAGNRSNSYVFPGILNFKILG